MKFSLVTSSGSFSSINKKTGRKFRDPARIEICTLEELIAFSEAAGAPLIVSPKGLDIYTNENKIEIYDDWRE